MIDWISEDAKWWGRQMRWIYMGKGDWPSRSMLGKLMAEGFVGAAVSKFTQFAPEVLDERALAFNVIVKRMSGDARERFFIHWAIPGKAKVKAWRLNESRSTYYDKLNRACTEFTRAMYLDKKQHNSPRQTEESAPMLRVA